MEHSIRHIHLPNAERVSTLLALILTSYLLIHYIPLPEGELSIQLPGFYIGINIGVQELIALTIALMTASGARWLLQKHPNFKHYMYQEHLLLPGVTAWVISLPLLQLSIDRAWWLGLGAVGIIILLVIIAEYIVVDPEDLRHPSASAGLTALAFALFLVLTTALRFGGMRLFLLIPTLAVTVYLVSLRVLRLKKPAQWSVLEAGVVTFITLYIAAALHYSPLSPIAYGLVLLGPAYTLTDFFANLTKEQSPTKTLLEPMFILLVIWGSALLIG